MASDLSPMLPGFHNLPNQRLKHSTENTVQVKVMWLPCWVTGTAQLLKCKTCRSRVSHVGRVQNATGILSDTGITSDVWVDS